MTELELERCKKRDGTGTGTGTGGDQARFFTRILINSKSCLAKFQ